MYIAMFSLFQKYIYYLLTSIVFYQRAKKIKDYIVRSKLYAIEREVGSTRCGYVMCQVCTSIQVTLLAFSVNRQIKSIIILTVAASVFLLSCKTCGKQYAGKTVDNFRIRWSNCKAGARKAASGSKKVVNSNFFKIFFCRMTIMNFLRILKLH